MIFTSFEFAIFFLAVLFLRSLLRDFAAEKWFLLCASYVFYMSWSIPCGFLILATTLVDFSVGIGLGRIQDAHRRKLFLVISIFANLGVLAFFKYTNFLVGNVSSGLSLLGLKAGPWQYDILLPAGISFFTFQSMTYTIETYRGNIKPCHSLRDFMLFVAFFPQLLAGPINRAEDLIPQFSRRVRASILDIEVGLVQFALGAIKKIVISDQISPYVDLVCASPGGYDGFTLLQALLGYAVQIYCDFSGYSDMAIGVARIMGFRFPKNFQMPYSSTTITEFWRRWHISLSTWLRDYLYIPLGGNRHGVGRTYVNLMITMFLGGLWHGASWNFVLWGGLHGAALAAHKFWVNWNPLKGSGQHFVAPFIWTQFSRLLTLGVVLLGWIFFRTQSFEAAINFIGRVLSWTHDGTHLVSPQILAAVTAVVMTHFIVQKDRNCAREIPLQSAPLRVLVYSALLLVLVCLGATDSAPFIYFQF